MKKLYLAGLVIFTSGINAKMDPDRPESQPPLPLSPVKKMIRTIDDFLGTENWGFQKLKDGNEAFIKNIIDDLEMNDYCIEIRGMSNALQRAIGRVNACVLPSLLFDKKSHSYMFISEEWFEPLANEEKQALVRHELMHLKMDHGKRRGRFALWSILIACIAKWNLAKQFLSIDTNRTHELCVPNVPVYLAMNYTIDLIMLLVLLKYIRTTEKEADIEAAKTMKDKQGFVDLFSNFKLEFEDPESKFRIKRFFHKIAKTLFSPITNIFSTHPSLDKRIEYIKALS